MNKTLITYIIIATLGFLASACNTMEGVGEDMEAAGEGIQEQANN
ncbi:MAG: entericidin A/B family lipoprotein [Verrucomicrobiae bacterium]|nr:entericidin A/B family lipoprotein [Verrucomicrobiae bacterium]